MLHCRSHTKIKPFHFKKSQDLDITYKVSSDQGDNFQRPSDHQWHRHQHKPRKTSVPSFYHGKTFLSLLLWGHVLFSKIHYWYAVYIADDTGFFSSAEHLLYMESRVTKMCWKQPVVWLGTKKTRIPHNCAEHIDIYQDVRQHPLTYSAWPSSLSCCFFSNMKSLQARSHPGRFAFMTFCDAKAFGLNLNHNGIYT